MNQLNKIFTFVALVGCFPMIAQACQTKAFSAHTQQIAKKSPMEKQDPQKKDLKKQDQELIQKLMHDHYGNFFNYLERKKAVNLVWREVNSLERLKNVVSNEKAPLKARFLACEVLFEKHFVFVGEVGAKIVAPIYVNALLSNQTGRANSWGFLYEHDDAGPTGIRFEMIGEACIPFLIPLLDNADQTLKYMGSKDAMVGKAYQYRIKDFAAFYLSEIMNIPIKFYQDLTQRDAEVARFKQQVLKK